MIALSILAVLAAQSSPPLKSFDDAMSAFMKESGAPGGALAVEAGGDLVYAKGYGLADVEKGVKVSPTSLFRIASISKPITAVAVLALVQQGKFDLDSKALALLGLKPGKDGDRRLADVTVRHLLQHLGGWNRKKSGDPMFKSIEISKAMGGAPPANAETIIRWMIRRPLDSAPGEAYAYSNFGYCVLGRIIEKVTGESYEAAVKRLVLKPLGITRMRLGRSLHGNRSPAEVRYYQPDPVGATPVFSSIKAKTVPWPYGGFCLEAMDAHGGWIASAVDLVRFAGSFHNLLGAKERRAMFSRPPGIKPNDVWYGCGWLVRRVKQGTVNTWHSGSLPGTYSLLVRRWDGMSWVVLFNKRSRVDGKIDAALHRAADAVETWPSHDLFPKYR